MPTLCQTIICDKATASHLGDTMAVSYRCRPLGPQVRPSAPSEEKEVSSPHVELSETISTWIQSECRLLCNRLSVRANLFDSLQLVGQKHPNGCHLFCEDSFVISDVSKNLYLLTLKAFFVDASRSRMESRLTKMVTGKPRVRATDSRRPRRDTPRLKPQQEWGLTTSPLPALPDYQPNSA
jgi:hypothetical protein